jgi:NADH-quinone oxidoreductase subunit L
MLYLVPLLPLAGFVVLIFFGKRVGRRAGALAVGVMALDAVLCVGLLALVARGIDVTPYSFAWWPGSNPVPLGFSLDGLGAVMIVVVTIVSALVHVFSLEYMADDPRYPRYFAYLQLFTASMLVLVLADSLALLYAGWELVGLSSYLLIGFWFEKPAAADAAKKAFVVTRIGDVGLLVGVLLLGAAAGGFGIQHVLEAVEKGVLAPALLTAGALLLFAGAMGKSAQFPLHVWLPDAMEGPTPVSALIHAATMVAAGVYLVARMFPVFEASPTALVVVAAVGAITALGAALIAVTQTDIKKVLAYSTISQLGLMFVALGVGARDAALFHLMTHASFKALLFLGAGSVIHATHHQEIDELGGLAKRMPLTAWTFGFGALALAGIPPFAGFWSKDEIVAATFEGGHWILAVVVLVTSFLTAVYISRLFFSVFTGEERVHHAAEGSWANGVPLVALATGAVLAGFVGSAAFQYAFQDLVAIEAHHPVFDPVPMIIATLVGASGIAVGWLGWGRERMAGDARLEGLGAAYRLAKGKFYIDEIYEKLLIRPTVALAESGYSFDKGVIDGAVDGVGGLARWLGGLVSKAQAGRVRRYAVWGFAGVVALIAVGLSLTGMVR